MNRRLQNLPERGKMDVNLPGRQEETTREGNSMRFKRGFAALLALCLMLCACASAAGGFDSDALMRRYSEEIQNSAIRDELEVHELSDYPGTYLNADESIQILFGDWGAVVYVLPTSTATNMPMVYLAMCIEESEPSAKGFEDWANVAWDGDSFDCAKFHADFDIGSTETTDDILTMRIELN